MSPISRIQNKVKLRLQKCVNQLPTHDPSSIRFFFAAGLTEGFQTHIPNRDLEAGICSVGLTTTRVETKILNTIVSCGFSIALQHEAHR